MLCIFFLFLFFILFSAFILFSRKIFFYVEWKMKIWLGANYSQNQNYFTTRHNKQCKRETIPVKRGLEYNNTSSVTIIFYNKLCNVPQKEKGYSISYFQINNFNWETFRKTTERTQIEIKESSTIGTPENFVDTETTISNKKVVSVDQKALASTYPRPDCSNEVTPNHQISRFCMWANVCKRLLYCKW